MLQRSVVSPSDLNLLVIYDDLQTVSSQIFNSTSAALIVTMIFINI